MTDESAFERTTLIRVGLRILPLVFVAYMIAFLNRVNIGYAALQMNEDLAFSAAVYGLGAGLFFIGYFLFEVPSNLILERVGPRVWIARIMITWGIISTAMCLITGPVSFYILRFLLGVAEAGFFPGVILYLTYWFPDRYLGRVTALFITAIPVISMLGSPISGWLLTLDGLGGLAGWQILFIVEGIPAVILGLLVLRYMTNRPEQARWLDPEQREWLTGVIHREQAAKSNNREYTLWQALTDGKVWVLAAIYFGILTSLYGISLWLPLIIQNFSPELGTLAIGSLAAIPYIGAIFGMVLFARHSDATGERRWHVAVPAALAAAGLSLSALFGSPVLSLAFLSLAALGIYATLGTFWTIPTAYLSGTAAAVAIALIGSVGNLGGFVGPYVIGYLRDLTGSYLGGLLFLAALILAAGVLVLTLREEGVAADPLEAPLSSEH